MKLPLRLGPARADQKNGGEFYVVKDAEGAWIGDIRAEHAPEIVVAINTPRPEALLNSEAVALANRMLKTGSWEKFGKFEANEWDNAAIALAREIVRLSALSPRGTK